MLDFQKMRTRRERLKLTLEDAAQRAGFSSRQQWYNIESGRRPDIAISTLEKIAVALECKPKDLLK